MIRPFDTPPTDPEASLTEQARDLRQRMREELGEDKARRIWASVGKRPRGRIPGKHVYDVSRLIELSDTVSKLPETDGWKREQLVRSVAVLAHARYPGRYGATEDAIAQHLKRTLKQRDKRDAERLAAFERWRSSKRSFFLGATMPTPPPTSLAALLLGADKKSG
jgi:hypothetical protein